MHISKEIAPEGHLVQELFHCEIRPFDVGGSPKGTTCLEMLSKPTGVYL
jgi:hypothetical protein